MENSYKESFMSLLKKLEESELIGSGYPNANILIIGQEKSNDESDNESTISYTKDWNALLCGEKKAIYSYPNDLKNKAGHTWNKYQKLHDAIFPEYSGYNIGVLNHAMRIFSTEMNIGVSKRNSEASRNPNFKENLEKRKGVFLKSEFIQQFPITILACSRYFKTTNEINEIRDIFGVDFIGEREGKFTYSKGNWFAIYKNIGKTKLVIHTRQLSGNIDDQLIKDIGNVIRNFLQENNIQLSSVD